MQKPKGYFSGFDSVPDAVKLKLWQDGLPFYLAHDKKPDTIVVCLHGYTATPYEAKPIGQSCFAKGMDAVGPLMPGHGYKEEHDQKSHLSAEMTLETMCDSVRIEIERARENYDNVFLFGQSMGGALALIAAGRGLVDACATTAPAIKLPRGAGLARWLIGWTDAYMMDKNQMQEKSYINYSYPFVGAKSGKEMHKISQLGKKLLPEITCPMLECHSQNDETIDPLVAKWIRDRVSGPVEIKWFNESGHTMPLDVQGEEICETIAQFFAQLL